MQAFEAQYRALADTLAERAKQDAEYGQPHDDAHDPTQWALLVATESGALCKQALDGENGALLYWRASRVAATALAWMESMQRLDVVDL